MTSQEDMIVKKLTNLFEKLEIRRRKNIPQNEADPIHTNLAKYIW